MNEQEQVKAVERAARALAVADGFEWDRLTPAMQDHFRGMAWSSVLVLGEAEATDCDGFGELVELVRLVAGERQRQVSAEGWTPEHDDGHADGELAKAAAAYALSAPVCVDVPWVSGDLTATIYDPWPWDAAWDKRYKHPRERQLVIAGALIFAELSRLRRARARQDLNQNLQTATQG